MKVTGCGCTRLIGKVTGGREYIDAVVTNEPVPESVMDWLLSTGVVVIEKPASDAPAWKKTLTGT